MIVVAAAADAADAAAVAVVMAQVMATTVGPVAVAAAVVHRST